MAQYRVTLTGASPLIVHNDNIEWRDRLTARRLDPATKKASKAGDDRSPSWGWIGCCYHDGARLTVSSDNVMTMLREAGTSVLTGAGKKTFKAQTQSGIVALDMDWPIVVAGGREIPWAPIEDLIGHDEIPFARHSALAGELGFELFAKSARIGQAKHVRVRPLFSPWSISGRLQVSDDMLTPVILARILEQGGRYKGLGDWRPSSPTPGPFGRFSAEIAVE